MFFLKLFSCYSTSGGISEKKERGEKKGKGKVSKNREFHLGIREFLTANRSEKKKEKKRKRDTPSGLMVRISKPS